MANRLSLWEPYRNMITLREAMDRLFEESLVEGPDILLKEGTHG